MLTDTSHFTPKKILLALTLAGPFSFSSAAPATLVPAAIWQYGDTASGDTLAIGGGNRLFISGGFYDNIDGQQSKGASDLFVTALSPTNKRLWTRAIGSNDNDYVKASISDAEGHLFLTGITAGQLSDHPPAGSFDVFVARLNEDGSIEWVRQIGSNKYETSEAIALDSAGNIYICGRTEGDLGDDGAAGGVDMYLASLSATGEPRWVRQFGSDQYDASLALTTIGDTIYVAGTTRGAIAGASNPSGRKDITLHAFSSAGDQLWAEQFGTDVDDEPRALVGSEEGALFLTGFSYGDLDEQLNQGKADVFVSRFDASGEWIWTRRLGSDASEYPTDIALGADNTILVAGYTRGQLPKNEQVGRFDAFIAAWGFDGSYLGAHQFGGPGFNQPNAIATTSNGIPFVLGNSATDLDEDPATGEGRIFLAKLGDTPIPVDGTIDTWRPNIILKRGPVGFHGTVGDSEDIDLSGTLDQSEDLNANGKIDYRSEDSNTDGQLQPGEDLDGDGLLNRDTGLASVALNSESENLVLQVTPFATGALSTGITIQRKDPTDPGHGKLVVTDVFGNQRVRDIELTDTFCATTSDLASYENSGPIHIPEWASSPQDAGKAVPEMTQWITRTDNPSLFETQPQVSYPSWSLTYSLKPDASGEANIWYEVVDYPTAGQRYRCGEEKFHISVLPKIETTTTPPPQLDRITISSGIETAIDLLQQAGSGSNISAISQPGHGQLRQEGNTGYYQSEPGYAGPDAFSYWTMDETGGEQAHRLLLEIVAVDGAETGTVTTSERIMGDSGERSAANNGGGLFHWLSTLLLIGIRSMRRRPRS